MCTLQCFTMLYTSALPDSLQCASFKIQKLYDIFEINSDISVLYKCKSQYKSWFTSIKHCKSWFVSLVKHDLHWALHFTLCFTLCITSVKHCKSHYTHAKGDLHRICFFLKEPYGQVRFFFLRKTNELCCVTQVSTVVVVWRMAKEEVS